MRLLQSLTRGLLALDYMSQITEPVRLTDVASALNVEKSNASHILKTLVAAGYAKQDNSRRYSTTDKVIGPERRQHSLEDIIACKETCRPVLEQLVEQTGECAHLAVLVSSRVWYIDKVDSTLPLKVDHPIGSLSPLHCTALGKAFLAFSNAKPKLPLEAFTNKTITSNIKLRSEIDGTRERGYAIDDEEFAEGIRCVARPVYAGDRGMIAALGLSGPTARINEQRLHELGERIRTTRIRLTGIFDE